MDDVISLWNYGEAELRGFLYRLNTYDRNLKFTLEVEIENKLPFLHVLIIRNTDKLDFCYLSKANAKQYFLFLLLVFLSKVMSSQCSIGLRAGGRG